MKVGDLILFRDAWVRDANGDPVARLDDCNGWSSPVLIIEQYAPPDESMFVGLDENCDRIVIAEHEDLVEVKVINESR